LAIASSVGAIQACRAPHPDFPKVPPPSDDCWEQHRVELLLAELAVRVLQTYGRLDPQLIQIDSESGALRQPNPEFIRHREYVGEFERALKDVNADEAARRAFAIGLASANAACGRDGCPATPYEIDITTNVMPDGAPFHHWVVKNEQPPSSLEWNDWFLRQYTFLSPQCCPMQPVLVVPDPEHPEADVAQADNAKGLASGPSGRRYASGASRESGPCYSGHVKDSCKDTCEKKRDVYGKWVNAGRETICCTC
jgi:hypothetical protein